MASPSGRAAALALGPCRSGVGRLLGPGLLGGPFRGVREKVELTRFPPWRRWPREGILKVKNRRLVEVEPSIDVFTCEDGERLADAISEVVPWKRRWEHHDWLHAVCGRVQHLLPQMSSRDVVRVILAFGQLYTRRKSHTLLFHNYETYALLFQALPMEAVTAKTLLPLLQVYRRMGISHEPFVRAACEQLVKGHVELEPGDLSEVIALHGRLGIRNKGLFDFAAEVLDFRFAYFSEDNVGDMVRAFCELRYRCEPFLDVLQRELPFRLHEYAWWNVIDIAEMYLIFQIQDREMIQRIGNEVFKLTVSMNYGYAAKALRVLAFLESAADDRTFRLLLRNLPRCVDKMDAVPTADTIMACAALKVEPMSVFHRTWGWQLYQMLTMRLLPLVPSLTAKKICDVIAALARVQQPEAELVQQVEALAAQRPYKFHAEHLVSLLRDLAVLKHPSPFLRSVLLSRQHELGECTPSALCALPAALAGHREVAAAPAASDHRTEDEEALLSEVSQLLCKPGAYRLPEDPRSFRSKDDFWWQQLRRRHFRFRRRAAGGAGGEVEPPAPPPDPIGESWTEELADAAIAHVSRSECLQLVTGSASLAWRDERLLGGVTTWICKGRRHAELEASEVSELLAGLAKLGYTAPLLRAALEHALLRVAPAMPSAACAGALRGALGVSISVRSPAVRALVRRCTSEVGLVPHDDLRELQLLSAQVRRLAEEELAASAAAAAAAAGGGTSGAGWGLSGLQLLRLPLELHLFGEAVGKRAAMSPL